MHFSKARWLLPAQRKGNTDGWGWREAPAGRTDGWTHARTHIPVQWSINQRMGARDSEAT